MSEPAGDLVRAGAEALRQWASDVFIRMDLAPADAAVVVDNLLWASLRGVDSHGVMRVPVYVSRLRAGGINARPRVRLVQERAAIAVLDGDNGMGQVVAREAMAVALRKAAEAGSSYVLVRHTNHFGAAGYWAEHALKRDMIGWATTNTPPIVAPWGSKAARIGNNPLAIAAPAGEEGPLVLDMALSMVAAGKLRYAARAGKAIPDDWALDPDGNPTTDPRAGLAGVLMPMGKHKGSGLAIAIEALTGLLAGTGWSEDVQYIWEHFDRPGNVASAFGAIDISAFIEPSAFRAGADSLARGIASAPPAPGFDRVELPGGPERTTLAERSRTGIPLPAGVIAELTQLGDELGLPFDPRPDANA